MLLSMRFIRGENVSVHVPSPSPPSRRSALNPRFLTHVALLDSVAPPREEKAIAFRISPIPREITNHRAGLMTCSKVVLMTKEVSPKGIRGPGFSWLGRERELWAWLTNYNSSEERNRLC